MAQTNLPFPKTEVGMKLYANILGKLSLVKIGAMTNQWIKDENNNRYYKEVKVSFHKFYLKPYEEGKDLPWLWFPTPALEDQYREQELRKTLRPKLNKLFGDWDTLTLEQLNRLNAFLDGRELKLDLILIDEKLKSNANHNSFSIVNQDGKPEPSYSISTVIKTIAQLTGSNIPKD